MHSDEPDKRLVPGLTTDCITFQLAKLGTPSLFAHVIVQMCSAALIDRGERHSAGVRERTATCVASMTGLPVPLSFCSPAVPLFDTLQGTAARGGFGQHMQSLAWCAVL